jgi:RNA recognition motif-containing protein
MLPRTSPDESTDDPKTTKDVNPDNKLLENERLGDIDVIAQSQDTKKIVKFFVGGVPPKLKKEVLAKIFIDSREHYNLPPCCLLDTICNNGFGFIIINSIKPEDVQVYIDKLVLTYSGRRLAIKLAEERRSAKRNRDSNQERKLQISNLAYHVTQKDIYQYFEQFGKIERCYLEYKWGKSHHGGVGFLFYENLESVDKCLNCDDLVLRGQKVIATKPSLKQDPQNPKSSIQNQPKSEAIQEKKPPKPKKPTKDDQMKICQEKPEKRRQPIEYAIIASKNTDAQKLNIDDKPENFISCHRKGVSQKK